MKNYLNMLIKTAKHIGMSILLVLLLVVIGGIAVITLIVGTPIAATYYTIKYDDTYYDAVCKSLDKFSSWLND